MTLRTRLRVCLLTAVAATLAACAPAVGVRSLKPEAANRSLTANVLNTGEPSERATEFLYRADLDRLYASDAPAALARLHAGLGERDESARLYALAELSFDHASDSGDRRYHLAAALYAWMFLFHPDEQTRAPRHDPRVRVAMDIYNRGIAEGIITPGRRNPDLSARTVELPFVTLEITTDPKFFRYGGYQLVDFTSLAGLETRGLRNRYRRRGIGAPVAASVARTGDQSVDRWIGPNARVPMTGLLRFVEPRRGLAEGRIQARLELYDAEVTTATEIAGEQVDLESELTASLAYRLQGSPLWDFEIAGFRRGDLTLAGEDRDNLYMLHPYSPGRIPVVFVHGTASSPARWAEMTNELMNDPVLGSRYQFWFFLYNTGNPVAYSASRLRQALTNAVAGVDPEGKDAALGQMVVIGHSQGGLLTKSTAISSGTRFWDSVSSKPFEQVALSQESRDLVRPALFFEPLPFVRRLVFIATPHRGAMMAGNIFGNLARRLVSLPGRILGLSAELVRLQASGDVRIGRMPTSIDNMTSTNPYLVTLVETPIAAGVHVHSIIPVKKGPPETGNDGVVAYTSAHLDGVDSELIVRSSHSTQAIPETIEEVRRILYLHLEDGVGSEVAAAMKSDSPDGAALSPSRPDANRGR